MKIYKEFTMGMFDNVRCEVPLPRGDKNTDFQTKDLDCVLETLVIAEGKPISDDRPDFHGFVEFYASDSDSKGLIVYRAKYTDGVLMAVTTVPGRYDSSPGVQVWPDKPPVERTISP